MTPKRLIAVHLLNDWSGSPLVFRQALEALRQAGYVVTLFTATPLGSGFLTDIEGVVTERLRYTWHPKKVVTLINYLLVQGQLFWRLVRLLQPSDVVYINTLLPFGAALAGRVRGCRVVYHVHEVSIKPWLLKVWLRGVANWTARQVLYVSAYTAKQTALAKPESHLIYNALPTSFVQRADQLYLPNTAAPFTALMLCSNKAYKGIFEFVEAARQLNQIRFMLVLNATATEVEAFVMAANPPVNCTIFPAQTDTLLFYQQAHVVLNLSHANAWIETFGLTILEGMACGRPVIVPPVGGVRELIDDGVEGFVIDALQPGELVSALQRLSSDFMLYRKMAQAARQRAAAFSGTSFQQQIQAVLKGDSKLYDPATDELAMS